MSAGNLCRLRSQVTYGGRKFVSAMGFFAPFPVLCHLRPGYGLDAPPDLGLVQLVGACLGWIKRATHVAYVVNPALERGDPATNECRQQVIGRHPLFFKLGDDLVDFVDFPNQLLRVVPPVVLLSGWTDNESR